jgi:hypothetical protein
MPTTESDKKKLLAERLVEEDYASDAQKRRMEDYVRRSGEKLFPIVVFNGGGVMALGAYRLLSNPGHYAAEKDGIWEKTLVSWEDFESLLGQEPEIPRHLASPEDIEELTTPGTD